MRIIILSIRDFFFDFKNNREIFAEKLVQLILYAVVFFVPFFYFPFFTEKFFEFSKIVLFSILIITALFLWLIKIYFFGKINLKTYFLDLPLGLLLLIYLLAGIFSIDRWQSFIGSDLVVGFSFIAMLLLVIFYFFISRFIKTLREIINVYYILLASFFLVSLINLINLLPIKIPFISTGTSVSNFSLIILLGFFISLILILLSQKKVIRIFFSILMAYFFVYFVVLDKPYILLILILSVFMLIFLLSLKAEKFSEKLIISLTLLLFVSVLAAILPVNKVFGLISVIDLDLPQNYAWEITSSTLGDDLLLGAGPQNFIYSFYKYKPISFNLSNLWQLGFLKNSNFWLEILNNIGLLGILIFLVILINFYRFFISGIRRLLVLDEFTYRKYILNCSLAIIFFALILFGLLYNYYFITIFIFFLFLGLAASSFESIKIDRIFSNKQVVSMLVYSALILLVCFSYIASKYIMADIYSEKASVIVLADKDSFDKSESYLKSAINLNENRSSYYLKYAKLYMSKLFFEINKEESLIDQDLFDKIETNLQLAMQKDKNKYDNYIEIYRIYSALKEMGVDVLDKQKQVNSRLLELNGNNPELYIDRALLHFDEYLLIKTEVNQSDESVSRQSLLLQKIKKDLEKSIELKPNYSLGYYNLGLYYQETGDENKSLENIKKAFDFDPSHQFIADNLKRLYLNQNKAREAIEVLNKYLQFNPNDNKLRLDLADIYRNNNQPEKAKEQALIVIESEPENERALEFLQ